MSDGGRGAAAGGSMGFMSLLQLALVILKLCGVIDWHWALVLLPAIISVGFWVIVVIVVVLTVCLRRR